MIGQRFGRLEVLTLAPRATSGNIMYECRCDCGSHTITSASNLRIGKTRSCGCLRSESAARATIAATKHGMKNTNTYRAWNAMLNRCKNPSVESYPNYGGRGISVCPQWHKFEVFFADMGACPPGLTLDRYPDQEGNYQPGNCRWATRSQQERNKRSTTYLEHEGVRQSVRDWEEQFGIPKDVFYYRVRNGWTPARIFGTPYQSHKAHPK